MIIRKLLSIFISIAFIGTSINTPVFAQMAIDPMPRLSAPGDLVHLSPEFTPAYLKGIVIHPENALKFDFIIYKGDKLLTHEQKKQEYTKLSKYFLASLAIPDDDQWVNLSPYEKDRIIKEDFGKTEMGRDLLAQDYMLKQITASLIYPESNLGKKFWDTVYSQARARFGTSNIPINTFNKVWILPDDALIYEKGNAAYVLKNHLRVMLEEDYLSLKKHSGIQSVPTNTHSIASKIVREIILPELEREVNEDENFAVVRQVYSGMLLATWYKRALKESLLSKIYANKAKVKGVDSDPRSNDEIYRQYLKAYKKGVFNFIKEDVDKYTNESIPRKYFSGGMENYAQAASALHKNVPYGVTRSLDAAEISSIQDDNNFDYVAVAAEESGEASKQADRALIVSLIDTSTLADDLDKRVLNRRNIDLGLMRAFYNGQQLMINGSFTGNAVVTALQDLFGDHPLPSQISYTVDSEKRPNDIMIIGQNLAHIISAAMTAAQKIVDEEKGDITKYRLGADIIKSGLYTPEIEERSALYAELLEYIGYLNGSSKGQPRESILKATMADKELEELNANIAKLQPGLAEASSEFRKAIEVQFIGLLRKLGIEQKESIKRIVEEAMDIINDQIIALKMRILTPAIEKMRVIYIGYDERHLNLLAVGDAEVNGIECELRLSADGQGNVSIFQRRPIKFSRKFSSLGVEKQIAYLNGSRPAQSEFASEVDGIIRSHYDSWLQWINIVINHQGPINPALVRGQWRKSSPSWKYLVLSTNGNEVDTNYKTRLTTESKINRDTYVAGVVDNKLVIYFNGDRVIVQASLAMTSAQEEQVRQLTVGLNQMAIDGPVKSGLVASQLQDLSKEQLEALYSIFAHGSELRRNEKREIFGARYDIIYALIGDELMAIAAMESGEGQEDSASLAPPVGGIDFNSANLNLQIKRDGKGVPLPISQQNLDNIHLNGLIPVILDIKPATGASLLSQLQI